MVLLNYQNPNNEEPKRGLVLDLYFVQKDIPKLLYMSEFPCDALRVVS